MTFLGDVKDNGSAQKRRLESVFCFFCFFFFLLHWLPEKLYLLLSFFEALFPDSGNSKIIVQPHFPTLTHAYFIQKGWV